MRLLLALAAAAPLFGQCTYTVSPTQFPSIAAGSGSGSVTGPTINVTAGSGCVWAATTNTSWLHVDFGQTGSGSGTVGWHADVNTVAAAGRSKERGLFKYQTATTQTVIASVSEAIHGARRSKVDCFVALLLAMTS